MVRLTALPLVGVRVTPVALRVLVLPAASFVVVPAALVTVVLPAPSVAVTLVNWLDRQFGRQPIAVEFAVYVVLGILWALPFRRVFRGIGKAE